MKLTAFISGHLDITEKEFEENYIPLIDKAIEQGDNFIVGDARGVDSMAQKYLAGKSVAVIVFHMFSSPRHNAGEFDTQGGFINDTARDRAMTLISNYDIAWVKVGREESGAAKNIKRRMKKWLITYNIKGVTSEQPLTAVVNANTAIVAKVLLKNAPSDTKIITNVELEYLYIEEITDKDLTFYFENAKFI